MDRRFFCGAASALMLVPLAARAADPFPTKPVRVISPYAAGGGPDVQLRQAGPTFGEALGQSIVIENKVGAAGVLAAQYVAQAAPDGYTLLIHHNGMATAPALYRKLPFDPLADFEYISQAVDVPMTLLGRKDLPPQNLQELTAYL